VTKLSDCSAVLIKVDKFLFECILESPDLIKYQVQQSYNILGFQITHCVAHSVAKLRQISWFKSEATFKKIGCRALINSLNGMSETK
jgi:hypothetical protein